MANPRVCLWLRAETKPDERRAPLVPAQAARLVQAGVELVVERSPLRIFSDEEYKRAGARMAEASSWRAAPSEAVILGLKELPDEDFPLQHRHIYFAHAYKGQRGAEELLTRFMRGGGTLFDLEYLADGHGRRVAAFGRWAGFIGAALGLDLWVQQRLSPGKPYPKLGSFTSQDYLIEHLRSRLALVKRLPSIMILGAKGRCGTGALDLLSRVGIENAVSWDKEETSAGGPFQEILRHEIFLNCVLFSGRQTPFLTEEMLDRPRRLSVISDISCDPNSPNNPLPVYRHANTFERPATRLRLGPLLDLTAIDNLPALLPRESSEDFSTQLIPHLQNLFAGMVVWERAEELFRQKGALVTGVAP